MKLKLQDILSGNILTKAFFSRNYLYMLLIAFLCIVYIHNIYRGQAQQKRIHDMQKEIILANTVWSKLSREYMTITRPSYLNEQLQNNGCKVKESVIPPVIIKD